MFGRAIIAVIQARMKSTRLPGKSLMSVTPGLSLLQMVLMRTIKATRIDRVVLATSIDPNCDTLEKQAAELEVDTIRGDENDVLSRFVEAVHRYRPMAVVRICADNPFVEPSAIDTLIEYFLDGAYQYACNNTAESGLPDGFGCEIMLSEVLEELGVVAGKPEWREHVTTLIHEHPDQYRIGKVPKPEGYDNSDLRLDIDTFEDLEKIRAICRLLPEKESPYWNADKITDAAYRYKKKQF